MPRTHTPRRPPAGLHALAIPVMVALALVAGATIGKAAPLLEKVAIVLYDDRIEMPDTLTAGTATLMVTNKGKAPHGLAVRAAGDSTDVKQLNAQVKPGESATLELALQPGRYEVYCPVGDHKQGGVAHRLTVMPARPPAESGGR